MRFSHAAVLALASLAFISSNSNYCDAFVVPFSPSTTTTTTPVAGHKASPSSSTARRMAGGWDNDDFLNALSPPSDDKSDREGSNNKNNHKNSNNSSDEDEDNQSKKNEDEPGSGSSKFKELLKAAEEAGDGGGFGLGISGRAIENPFLSQPSSFSTPLPTPAASNINPDELSVEEQARRFREMMAQQQQQQQGTPPVLQDTIPPPPPRVAKTDRAGRPVGRNRDADSIANTADVYFAQLKRDSTVRTIARLRGEEEVAEQVFADDGIKELEDLLVKNPYLQGQRDKEKSLIDTIPEEALSQYFNSGAVTEEEKKTSGISYRQKLMERKQKAAGGQAQAQAAPEMSIPVVNAPPPPSQPQGSTEVPPPLNPPIPIQENTGPSKGTSQQSNLSPDESRKKIRTLMGMILKHRGGPGFGKGRLKGPEVDRFSDLLNEVTGMLRDESKFVNTDSVSAVSSSSSVPSAVASATAASATTTSTNIDSTLACIDGAIAMYKNSPPQLKDSVLFTLRAALVSAVETCNGILSMQPLLQASGSADGQIDNTIAVIEGAVSMYRNSPPQLQESVLVTLRAALMSAVETCNVILGDSANVMAPQSVPTPQAVMAPPPVSPPPQQQQQPRDANSVALDKIYNSVRSAAGDGRLGLRSDLTSAEATELADQLVEMRSLLMEELETGIPDPKENSQPPVASQQPQLQQEANGATSTSSASKYQQMLARARAEKAAGQ